MKTDSLILDNDFHILQGKKIKKPFYKKTWFGTVVFVVLLVAFFAFIVVVTREDEGKVDNVSTEVSKGNVDSKKKSSALSLFVRQLPTGTIFVFFLLWAVNPSCMSDPLTGRTPPLCLLYVLLTYAKIMGSPRGLLLTRGSC